MKNARLGVSRLVLGREIALDSFVEVMDHRRRPEQALSYLYNKHRKNLKRVDKNFVKETLYGSLRWQAKIFWILQNTANRDLTKTTPQIRAALVVGAYQIYYMDRVADRVAVNESVEYIRKKGQANACSFVNGILRQIARRAEYFTKPDKHKEPANYLALQYAHPRWLIDRWLVQFHYDKVEGIASANNKPPPTFIRVNTKKGLMAYQLQNRLLKEEHLHSEKRPLRCSLRCRSFPNLDEGSLFAGGLYTIQDEAAQLVSFMVDPQENQQVLDLCCGPGGKLSHLYELSNGKAQITAVDKKKSSVALAKETMLRLGHDGVTFVEDDILQWDFTGKVDKILLDAPCSALGVLRRHPEGKWHKEEAIVAKMSNLQRQMIVRAFGWLKEGGELIFSVCSFENEESNDLLDFAKSEFGDRLAVVSPVVRVPDYYKRYVTRKNVLQIYSSNNDSLDGFSAFIVRAVA